MRVVNYREPKSSFLSMDKDLGTIIDSFFKNKNLKKLLYYTTPNALKMKDLSEEQSVGLIGKNIKIVPKLYIDGSVLAYVIISFDNFTPKNVSFFSLKKRLSARRRNLKSDPVSFSHWKYCTPAHTRSRRFSRYRWSAHTSRNNYDPASAACLWAAEDPENPPPSRSDRSLHPGADR